MAAAISMAYEMRCRKEDMAQRSIDNQRRAIDDARRAVDEKTSQLRAISELSALIAGFAMITMVEAQLPIDLHMAQCVLFGLTGSSVVALMLTAMLQCCLLLIAILK